MTGGNDEDAVHVPINGILDLHSFSPKDLKTLIPEYINECRKRHILEIRFIHGKGVGNIQRSVHALLQKQSAVRSFHLAGNDAGGWGATIVTLMPQDEK